VQIHTNYTRDAALRELHRINRWLIASSVVLTGVLSDVAAHAFPGKAIKTIATTGQKRTSTHPQPGTSRSSGGSVTAPSDSLHPPAQAPKATTETAPAHESAPTQEPAPVV
jgi:hypothetical protein